MKRIAVVLSILFSLTASACASINTTSTVAQVSDNDGILRLDSTLSPCLESDLDGDQIPAESLLGAVEQWWRIDSADVEEILGRDDLPPGFGGNPAEFKFEGSRTAGPDSATPILLADAFVAPALDLANDSQTSVHAAARAGGLIMFVLVENPDGQLALGGSCANQILGDAIQRTADPEATLRSLPTKASEELSAVLPSPTENRTPDDIVLLNPASISEDRLEALSSAIVFYELDQKTSSPGTICARSSAGWNDCFLTDSATARHGMWIESFFEPDDPELHLHFFPEKVDLGNPGPRIGTVDLSNSPQAKGDIAIDVRVFGAQAEQGRAGAAQVVGQARKLTQSPAEDGRPVTEAAR